MEQQKRVGKRKKIGRYGPLTVITLFVTIFGVIFMAGCISPETEQPEDQAKITFDEAREIAQNSDCVKDGSLTDTYVYNPSTRTWWIDLEPFTPREGCNPACVVSENTKTAEINWRCTGALPPLTDIKNETCTTKKGESMRLSEALRIAGTSECVEVGILTADYFCNPDTGTWWIDIAPHTEKEGCNPACVVNITAQTAEVNWRCTGVQ
jgi:hypothetical protein